MGATLQEQRRFLKRENAKFPFVLVEIPREKWEKVAPSTTVRVLRSRDFLVQVHETGHDRCLRLSVCRTDIQVGGRWKDGISWDDLQRLKREAGYADRDAVEIYPADNDVVNVANMRHIFLTPEPIPFAWRRISE